VSTVGVSAEHAIGNTISRARFNRRSIAHALFVPWRTELTISKMDIFLSPFLMQFGFQKRVSRVPCREKLLAVRGRTAAAEEVRAYLLAGGGASSLRARAASRSLRARFNVHKATRVDGRAPHRLPQRSHAFQACIHCRE